MFLVVGFGVEYMTRDNVNTAVISSVHDDGDDGDDDDDDDDDNDGDDDDSVADVSYGCPYLYLCVSCNILSHTRVYVCVCVCVYVCVCVCELWFDFLYMIQPILSMMIILNVTKHPHMSDVIFISMYMCCASACAQDCMHMCMCLCVYNDYIYMRMRFCVCVCVCV